MAGLCVASGLARDASSWEKFGAESRSPCPFGLSLRVTCALRDLIAYILYISIYVSHAASHAPCKRAARALGDWSMQQAAGAVRLARWLGAAAQHAAASFGHRSELQHRHGAVQGAYVGDVPASVEASRLSKP